MITVFLYKVTESRATDPEPEDLMIFTSKDDVIILDEKNSKISAEIWETAKHENNDTEKQEIASVKAAPPPPPPPSPPPPPPPPPPSNWTPIKMGSKAKGSSSPGTF